MKSYLWFIILISLVIALGCDKTRYEYYDNGNVKQKYIVADGKLNGTMETFYENGTIMSRSEWKDSVLNGLSLEYYENGQIKNEAYYRNNKLLGEVNIFYPTGELLEKQVYDSITGNMLSYSRYDKEGRVIKQGSMPKFIFENNIVKPGEDFVLKIDYSHKIYDSTRVYLGTLTADNLSLQDTTEVLYNKSDVYIYTVNQKKPGTYTITGMATETNHQNDTIKSNVIPFSIIYYVKE